MLPTDLKQHDRLSRRSAITFAAFIFSCVIVPRVAVAICPADSDASPRRPISKNSAGEFVPAWAKRAVWYQVFPERFRNGDPNNDPTAADIVGADPVEAPKAWQVHPWGSDWYKLQVYEHTNGDKEFWKHALRRRYGGDLQGVIDKLDYIKEMGFNAIYLNPVFDAPSLHKYDGASYHHIDPNFGPDPQGDRQLIAHENPLDPATWVWTKADELALELIDQAHQRNIRVIFDGVFNHLGINSFAFRDLKKNQRRSPYREWFTVLSWRDSKRRTPFAYKGWAGYASLPELAEDKHGLLAGPKRYVLASVARWMNPKNLGAAYGVDGWRLDVAFCVAHGFWKDFRSHVKAINSAAYLTGEIVDTPDRVKPFLQGDEFDGEMNYNFAFASAEFFFNPQTMRITATQFDEKLERLRRLYPKGVAYVTQNLFGSHDTNRIGSHIVNRGVANFRDWDRYRRRSVAANNPEYKVRKPTPSEIRLQKLFAIFQMTYVGAPMVYYGDEVGMWGGNDPDSRKPMLWPDIAYEDEVHNVDGSTRNADKVNIDSALKAHYKKLIAIRNGHPALQVGNYQTILANDARELFGFKREHRGERVWVLLNKSQGAQTISIRRPAGCLAEDALAELPVKADAARLTVTVPGEWGAVLIAACPER